MSIDSENPLLIEVLTGSSTSYTYKPTDQIVDVSSSILDDLKLLDRRDYVNYFFII